MADIIPGVAELERAFLDLKGTTGRVVHSSLQRIGLLAQREAKANAPRSPTNKILSATLKRKKRTSRKMMPGGLEKSIVYEILPGDECVSVFVAQNGLCRSKKGFNYAKRIHDEKGVKWFKRGPGTIAKGPRADAKFIERAVTQNRDKFLAIFNEELHKLGL